MNDDQDFEERKEIGSASYGIDFNLQGEARWYNWIRFPLVPIIHYDPGDQWNSSGASFSWLNFRLWTVDDFAIGLEFMIEEVGIWIRFRIPYVNMYLWLIPFP